MLSGQALKESRGGYKSTAREKGPSLARMIVLLGQLAALFAVAKAAATRAVLKDAEILVAT